MKSFLESINKNFPKSFKYFEDYYSENFDDEKFPLESLNFEMGLGLFLSFFNHINSDIELYSYEKEALKDAVNEAFSTYEEYLFLDS